MAKKQSTTQSQGSPESKGNQKVGTSARQAAPTRDRAESGSRQASTSSSAHTYDEESPEFKARVARKAFELFEHRGGEGGRDVDDWLEAERQVKEEMNREPRRLSA